MQTADVVVVGGGILGCSIALHLARAGAGDVVVLERDGIGQATSNAGAGFVALWGGGHVSAWGEQELALERYAIDVYRELDATDDIGFKANGTAWLCTSESMWSERLKAMEETPLIRTETLDGAGVATLTGITDPNHVYRGVFQPDGIQVHTGAATVALGAAVRREGGRVLEHCPVRSIRVDSDNVIGVETAHETIDAPVVVLAAGAWTNALLSGVDRWLPMVTLMASRITTGPMGVPATMPGMIWPEFNGMWVRENHGGLVWGCGYTAAPRFTYMDAAPPERFDQLPMDGVDEIREVGRRASAALPILAKDMSMSIAHGGPCYTPDVLGLVGPLDGLSGLWVASGCNEAGVTHGPGYGKLIADMVTSGTSELSDTSRIDPNRFAERYAGPAEFMDHVRTMIHQHAASANAE